MLRRVVLALSVVGCLGQDGPLGGTNITARGLLLHGFGGEALCIDITQGWNPNSKLDLARCQDGNIAMLFTTWSVSGQYYFTTGPTGNLHQYCISKGDATDLVLNLCTVSGPSFLWRVSGRTLRDSRGGLCAGTSTAPADKAPLVVTSCTGGVAQSWAIDKLPFSNADGGGLSGGSLFLILLIVGASVYIIFGCLFNIVKNKTAPADACPQKAFWLDCPNLIKDGCRFALSKVTGGKGGSASYNEL